MPKAQNQKIKKVKAFDPENPTLVTFVWNTEPATESTYDSSKYPQAIRDRLEWQATVGKDGDVHSKCESVADAMELSDAMNASLIAGDWFRKGGGKRHHLIPFIQEEQDLSEADAVLAWSKFTDAQKSEYSLRPATVEWVNAQKLAKAKDSETDFGSLFHPETETDDS